jgi:hypothetical protein
VLNYLVLKNNVDIIKTGCHDIAEILLNVAFKIKNQLISKQLDRTKVSQLRNVFSIYYLHVGVYFLTKYMLFVKEFYLIFLHF